MMSLIKDYRTNNLAMNYIKEVLIKDSLKSWKTSLSYFSFSAFHSMNIISLGFNLLRTT